MAVLIALVLLFPLLSLMVNFVMTVWMPHRWRPEYAGWTATAGPGLSFLAGVGLCVLAVHAGDTFGAWHLTLWDWMRVVGFTGPFRFHVDALTLVMILTVTGIGTLIHAYSVEYMRNDPGVRRYFVLLNLFIVMMLFLVMADHLVLMFVGWEGVGLCSYLLIAHWFERPSAADAGRKAFIVNRVGDAGFLIGIFMLGMRAGTLQWEGLATWTAQGANAFWITLAALALFIGATGKSAQIPLYVWLPDAMEGPTPVSALIHAATMVTAGVYMIVRLHFLFDHAPVVQGIVVAIGVLTALYAAVVALAQTEMKRILAFSTISQIGYMFIGAGLGAYVAAMFHLVTHAFFKALLFLATGNVMHATDNEQDIWRLGRLREQMPTTHRLFWIGVLALAGLPPLAGFFSKEAILTAAWAERPILWALAWLTAGVTALYAVRLVAVPFFHPRLSPGHPHEPSPVMQWPQYVLAGGSVFAGLILGFPAYGVLTRFLHPWMRPHSVPPTTEWALFFASTAVAVVGVWMAWTVYVRQWDRWRERLHRWEPVRHALEQQIGWNTLYDRIFVRPLFWLSERVVFRLLDVRVIDGLLDGTAFGLMALSRRLSRVQTGNLKVYAYGMLVGTLILVVYFYLVTR